MAALTRKLLKLFGETGSAADFGQFGSLADATKVTSKDIDTLQANAAWAEGWQDATLANKRPAYQDFNGWQYVHAYELFYLFEKGVAEWIATQTYYVGSIASNGAGVLYASIQNTNLNHALSDAAWWTAIAPFTPTAANALAGSVVQVVNAQTGAQVTGTTVLPFDDTIPQNTEGDEYITIEITPKSATNKLRIDVNLDISHSTADNYIGMALFQDSTAGALAATGKQLSASANTPNILSLTFYMTAGTTSATTFKVRAGCQAAGTTALNSLSGTRLFGGVCSSSITITEVKV